MTTEKEVKTKEITKDNMVYILKRTELYPQIFVRIPFRQGYTAI